MLGPVVLKSIVKRVEGQKLESGSLQKKICQIAILDAPVD